MAVRSSQEVRGARTASRIIGSPASMGLDGGGGGGGSALGATDVIPTTEMMVKRTNLRFTAVQNR